MNRLTLYFVLKWASWITVHVLRLPPKIGKMFHLSDIARIAIKRPYDESNFVDDTVDHSSPFEDEALQ